MSLSRIFQDFLLKNNIVLHQLKSPPRDLPIEINLLRDSAANVVLDVGANVGQFAKELCMYGVRHTIISFEPLSQPHRQLLENSQPYSNWIVAPPMAVGDMDGEIEINVLTESTASSILKTTALLESSSSAFTKIKSETVQIRCLDSVCNDYITAADRIYLKVDVQGFEKQVLDGAIHTLEQVDALQVELSFVELYQGQAMFSEIFNLITGLGFSLYSFSVSGHRDNTTKALQQCDGFFIRTIQSAAKSK